MGIKRRITAEGVTQITSKIDQIGTGINPILQIRKRNHTRWIDIRVRSFDDHVTGGIDVDTGRMARVRVDEPDNDRNVVGVVLIDHRNCAVGLEKVNGTAVVVGESGGLGLERRKSLDEREKVLADEPFDVFGVRKRRWTSLRENG